MDTRTLQNILLIAETVPAAGTEKVLLEQCGYTVVTACTGQQALDVLGARADIDLVLVNLDPAGRLNGAAAAKTILEKYDLPLLFLAAPEEQDHLDEAVEVRAGGFVGKNSGRSLLAASVRSAHQLFQSRVAERRKEAELLEESRRLESIIEGTRAGTWEWNIQTEASRLNERWAELAGYGLSELHPITPDTLKMLIHPDDFEDAFLTLDRCLSGEDPSLDCECRLRHRSGRWVWIQARGKVITRTAEGKPLMMFGTVIDITERKKAEQTIRDLLAEKETLLREVNHRIKNNMLSIEKLLSIQSRTTGTAGPKEAMLQARGYVAGMRILYEKMLHTGDYRYVSISRYLNELLGFIMTAFPSAMKISLVKEIEDLAVSSKILFPVSIIVNELITNTMKYAFPDGDHGTIAVTVERVGSRVRLLLEDDGIGLPEGFDPESSGTFGLRLVSMMSHQIGGTFEVENREDGKGLRSRVEFPLDPAPGDMKTG